MNSLFEVRYPSREAEAQAITQLQERAVLKQRAVLETEIINKLATGGNPFYGHTATVERPEPGTTGVSGRSLYGDGKMLAQAQAAWDAAKVADDKLAAHSAAMRAEREAKQQAAEEAQRARETERVEATRAKLLEPARRAFLAAGGTTAEWEGQKADVERQIRQQLAIEAATKGEQDAGARNARAARTW